ncbi:MAG TPA: hybrid sensor histidine kinase/response regulator [Trichocoleus sp.]|jgi:chemotaxis family two-component system sensor histidine kinase/response regulator PixL
MTINPEIRDQAYQFFLEEAPELLQAIEAGLLTLRQGRDLGKIHSIMRSAHSLKGGAASVGLDVIKSIAHRIETIFKALYSEQLEVNADLENQLLQAFDCLRVPLTEQLTQGYFDAEQALATAEPILSQLEAHCQEAIVETENFIPSSTDLGLNMATSIVEIDVQQGLAHLETVLAHPQSYGVAGEVRAQAEVFFGFSELLNLPGFASIAQTTIEALDKHPHRALEIAALALADFRAGRDAILAGDSMGGCPSEALAAFTTEIIGNEANETSNGEIDLWAAIEVITPEEMEVLLEEIEEIESFNNFDEITEICSGNGLDDFSGDDLEDEIEIELATEKIAAEFIYPQLDDIFGNLEITPLSAPETEAPPEPITLSASEPLDRLPAVNPAQSTPFTKSSPATKKQPLTSGLTVRVDAERLTYMNNLLGELTINRNGLALQTDQSRLAIRELLSRFERVRSTVEQLRSASDQMLITPELQVASRGTGRSQSSFSAFERSEFDSLEMDSYSGLYSYAQTLLEEMVQLEEAIEDIALFNHQSQERLGQHRKMLSRMQDELMWARMFPLSEILNHFPRILRDLSNTYQKPVNLTLNGTELLVDKAVLEKLYDPLLHLLRNGFDHGIESAEIRQNRSKSETGQIEIRAYYKGRQMVIEVRDDGQGLDLDRIRQRIVELGWLTEAEVIQVREAELYEFIFEPGFSTATQVSELSGRGIGLDVVREQLRSIKGTVTVQSIPERGTNFILTLPFTLTITNLLICFVGSTPIALRSDGITEVLVPKPDQVRQIGSDRWLKWQQQQIPIYRLSEQLAYNCLIPETPPSRVLAAVPSPADWEAPMLIVKQGELPVALQVDRLVTEQELVIKPFGAVIAPPAYVYGCTVLGDGSLIPVVDGLAFLDHLLNQETTSPIEAGRPKTTEDNKTIDSTQFHWRANQGTAATLRATTVLVVDDAITSRRTLAASLERAGYRVLQARDGQEALEQLQQNRSLQLVICDIEMPNMNGFEFLTQRRQDPDLAHIPTVMLTSRSNDKHRWLAMQLGAVDYFTKPYLEQEFLSAIAPLCRPGSKDEKP